MTARVQASELFRLVRRIANIIMYIHLIILHEQGMHMYIYI